MRQRTFFFLLRSKGFAKYTHIIPADAAAQLLSLLRNVPIAIQMGLMSTGRPEIRVIHPGLIPPAMRVSFRFSEPGAASIMSDPVG